MQMFRHPQTHMVCDWKLVFVDIYGFHLKVGRRREGAFLSYTKYWKRGFRWLLDGLPKTKTDNLLTFFLAIHTDELFHIWKYFYVI